jgi:hypothetical protein
MTGHDDCSVGWTNLVPCHVCNGLGYRSFKNTIGQERLLGSRRKPALQLRELQHMARLHRAPVQPFPATRKACAPLISCLTPGRRRGAHAVAGVKRRGRPFRTSAI